VREPSIPAAVAAAPADPAAGAAAVAIIGAVAGARSDSTGGRDRRFDGVVLLLAIVALMWVLEVVDVLADHSLDQYGIEPRDEDGLVGIVAAPFLHVGFGHLAANTVPFLAMGVVIALQGVGRLLAVTAIVALVSGLGTWLVASGSSVHLGASGLVFGYATYLMSRGVFNRDAVEVVIGVVVVGVWGTALLGGVVPQGGISWQGHLFGAVGGVIAARVLARERQPREQTVQA
jgi:membrane associated rhomboid family serine protease